MSRISAQVDVLVELARMWGAHPVQEEREPEEEKERR